MSLGALSLNSCGLPNSSPIGIATFGNVDATYGSFGTPGGSIGLGFGNDRVGNFLAIDGVRSGRFLDTPEFTAFHDIGNSQTIYPRHLHVEKNQVGRKLFDRGDCFRTVIAFADDDDFGIILEKFAQAFAGPVQAYEEGRGRACGCRRQYSQESERTPKGIR